MAGSPVAVEWSSADPVEEAPDEAAFSGMSGFEPEIHLAADGCSLPSEFRTQAEDVNRRLASCLQKLDCRLKSHEGIWRSARRSERCMAGRSPYSCHILGYAIDIKTATCDLAELRDCLDGFGFRACYRGKGGCRAHSVNVLHFGRSERRCFLPIWRKYGGC